MPPDWRGSKTINIGPQIISFTGPCHRIEGGQNDQHWTANIRFTRLCHRIEGGQKWSTLDSKLSVLRGYTTGLEGAKTINIGPQIISFTGPCHLIGGGQNHHSICFTKACSSEIKKCTINSLFDVRLSFAKVLNSLKTNKKHIFLLKRFCVERLFYFREKSVFKEQLLERFQCFPHKK